MNWGCVILSLRNKKKGIDRHHSTVPLVSLLLAYFAFGMYPYLQKSWIGIIPLLDIGNLTLLWLPVVLVRELKQRIRREAQK